MGKMNVLEKGGQLSFVRKQEVINDVKEVKRQAM